MTARASRQQLSEPVIAHDKPIIAYDDMTFYDLEMLQLIGLKSQSENKTEADLQSLYAQMRELMARLVRYLPASYFSSQAPTPLDFSAPDTYKWLKSARTAEVITLLGNPESAAGE
jgi:hypothetical protein